MSNTLKFLLGLLLLSSTFVACNQKKDQATEEAKDWYIDPRESTHMQRTMTDTLAVLYNTKQYLNYLKANELDSALNMLYELSGDSVLPLSVDGKNQMIHLQPGENRINIDQPGIYVIRGKKFIFK